MQAFKTTLALAALAIGGAAMADSGGKIATLERGDYVCEHPGDVTTARGVVAPEEGFTVTNASTYTSPMGGGSYLRTGDTVTMTSGPKKGMRYDMKNERFLRRLGPDGKPDGLRCVRVGG